MQVLPLRRSGIAQPGRAPGLVVTHLARKGRCTTVIKGTGGRRVIADCLVISGCSSGVRARGRGPRGRWCDSSHPDEQRRPVRTTSPLDRRSLFARSGPQVDAYRNLVDAGETPVAVHDATVPRNGTRFCEDRRQRFNSSRWHQGFASLRLGRCRIPTPVEQRSIRWRRADRFACSLSRAFGPPCGVTAARSSLAF